MLCVPLGKRLAFSALVLAAVSACSVNEYGVVEVDSFQSSSSDVSLLRAPGAHLALTGHQSSLTFGWIRRIQVRAPNCAGVENLLLLEFFRSYGIRFALGADGVGVTIGMREKLHLNLPDLNKVEIARSVYFDTKNIYATKTRLEETDC